MTLFDQQLHGYRQGHQLLSTSVKLPKSDQDLVDRLSDAAGPQRPGELFKPYLTCYPLPSGLHYVFACTWQDFNAPRAGCVRTRSLILPMLDWTAGVNIPGLVESLYRDGPLAPAERIQTNQQSDLIPNVDISQSVELVEALFLEERKPIVMFDSSDPEGITLRLLMAVWPSFRRSFAVSTFALSPRTLGGRSFDLVFAPKDARPRFSDWSGRRIDAKKPAVARHRWSCELVDRIFGSNNPTLLQDDVLGELSSENGATEAELRISLLWNELHNKLEKSPNAALGLLDIANSRSTRNMNAIRRLEPELGRAAQRAAATLPSPEAWRFLLALTEKLRDVRLQLSVAKAIRGAAVQLASRLPIDAIANVKMLSTARGHKLLLGAVGDGVALGFDNERAAAIVELDPAHVLQLLLLSPTLAKASLTHYPDFSAKLAIALAEAPEDIRSNAKHRLLRLLVDDQHADAARSLIADLNLDELLAEVKLLDAANGLAAWSLHGQLIERAIAIGAIAELRNTVVRLSHSRGTDILLLNLIAPIQGDLQWLLDIPTLADERRIDLLRHLLRSASARQLKSMVAGRQLDPVLQLLMRDPAGSFDIIDRLLEDQSIDASTAVDTTMRLLAHANSNQIRRFASRALEIILSQNTGTNHYANLDKLLSTMGSNLNGSQAIRIGLKRELSAEVFATNLSAFNRCPSVARQRIMLAIDDLALMIVGRGRIDYPEHAVVHAASLILDSSLVDQKAFVRSSVVLFPFLLRCQREPVSPLIAVVFPPVYQELKKADDASDFFKLMLFVDRDKCKIAIHELINAFMHSNWRATDIALAAARAGALNQILRHMVKQNGGDQVVDDIKRNLSSISNPWRDQVSEALKNL